MLQECKRVCVALGAMPSHRSQALKRVGKQVESSSKTEEHRYRNHVRLTLLQLRPTQKVHL